MDPNKDTDSQKDYKYYVMYKFVDVSIVGQFVPNKGAPLSYEHTPQLYTTLCDVARIIYTVLAKHEILLPEIAKVSPHAYERVSLPKLISRMLT